MSETHDRKRVNDRDVYIATYVPKSLQLKLFELQAIKQQKLERRVTMAEIIKDALEAHIATELSKQQT